jgi:hypothetical protein
MRGSGARRNAMLSRPGRRKIEERRRWNSEKENPERPSDKNHRRKSTKKIQHVQTAKLK